MSVLIEWAQALEATEIAVAIAESQYAFLLIEAAHLLGLALSLGLLAIADLRLLGLLLRQVPAGAVLRQLRPWVIAGFVLTFLTGLLLFAAAASKLIENPAFIAKLLLIVLAALNALLFETRLARRAADWGDALRLPAPVRAAGLASLSLWGLVLITGRLIPYLD